MGFFVAFVGPDGITKHTFSVTSGYVHRLEGCLKLSLHFQISDLFWRGDVVFFSPTDPKQLSNKVSFVLGVL